jgi:type I restriction enzyme M protein
VNRGLAPESTLPVAIIRAVTGLQNEKTGEFYTPESVARLLTEMTEPCRGRIYDPCCGTGSLLVESVKFVEAQGGSHGDVRLFGQESNAEAWRTARKNLESLGIEANLGEGPASALLQDLHPELQADFILAHPPFNVSGWGGERLENDPRWRFGEPPNGNANFAWVQHFVHHLAADGVAGFVLANASTSSMQSAESEIRRRLVEADLVACLVACPGQLFYATQVPVCLWLLSRRKHGGEHRDRRHQVLFLDARAMGRMETRVHRVLDDDDVTRIAGTYHAWHSRDGDYRDVPGFCKSATVEQIAARDFELTPGRYVGAAAVEDDAEPFEERMARLMAELQGQVEESAKLDRIIKEQMERIVP